jgi:hypothetical protein
MAVARERTKRPLNSFHSVKSQSESQSYITTDGHSASLSWCQAPICDPLPIFLLLSLIIWDSCGFVDVGRPLWREAESAVFSWCWASPTQSFGDARKKIWSWARDGCLTPRLTFGRNITLTLTLVLMLKIWEHLESWIRCKTVAIHDHVSRGGHWCDTLPGNDQWR